MQSLQFGIDLGGTKTELIVLDRDGKARFRQRVSTPATNYNAIVQTITSLVSKAELELGVDATSLGVGAPGTPFGSEGRLKNANTTCLIGKPLATDLRAALGIPIVVENDANCLVLSEAKDGAGANAAIVFGVILGTGVGGALVINGKLVNGPNRIAGEWGHNPLPRWFDSKHGHPCPRRCYCGLDDCIETYLCGRGLIQTYNALLPSEPGQLTTHAIVHAAKAGQQPAQQALSQYFDALSDCLATVINVVDPDIIVFGGGLSQLPGLCESVHSRLPARVFGADMATRLAIAMHGDSSGVRGAAWLTEA